MVSKKVFAEMLADAEDLNNLSCMSPVYFQKLWYNDFQHCLFWCYDTRWGATRTDSCHNERGTVRIASSQSTLPFSVLFSRVAYRTLPRVWFYMIWECEFVSCWEHCFLPNGSFGIVTLKCSWKLSTRSERRVKYFLLKPDDSFQSWNLCWSSTLERFFPDL